MKLALGKQALSPRHAGVFDIQPTARRGLRHSAHGTPGSSTLSPLAFWAKGTESSGRGKRWLLKWPIAALLFLCCVVAFAALAQEKDQPSNPAEPTITFDLFWEAATPQTYAITVESSGKGKYISRSPAKTEPGSDAADPDYVLEFNMSPATRDRIFTLAKAANYFDGNFDYKHKVANTGKKTLAYADPTRHFQTTYNYSENKDIEEITKVFQGISATIEHGRKLQFMRRFDKLSLDKELKGMEEMAQSGYLAEIQIIAPLLQNIANDSSVLHMARQRAQHLLAAGSPP